MKEIDIDIALIRQVKEGNEKAFKDLFMKYFARLCAFVFNIIKSDEKAQDIVQRVFARLWEKRGVINITETALGYLFRSCRNETLNQMKSEQTRRKYEQHYLDDYEAIHEVGTHLEEAINTTKLIDEAIKSLPNKCREIFQMSKQEGLSYQEIATYLKVSEKTVENQIGIALKKLRESLKPHIAWTNE